MPNENKIELRNNNNEVLYKTTVNTGYRTEKRADGSEEIIFDGHIFGRGIPFNETANICDYFEERIEPGAILQKVLKDVAMYTNHETNDIPLARSRNGKGSLKLEIKDDGVYYDTYLDINNDMEARRLCSAIYRGDIIGTSFIMHVKDEEWEDRGSGKLPLRTIKEIDYLQEISLVNYPAYDSTNVTLRSAPTVDSARATLDNGLKQLLEKRQNDEGLKKAEALAELKKQIKNKYEGKKFK